MKKVITILLIILAVILGWYLLADNDNELTTEAEAIEFAMEDEIAELEAELATVDAAVQAGTLTEAQATEAKAQIVTKIANIEAMSNTPAAGLTASQRLQLSAGLTRLESILTTYRATLVAVDEKADPVAVKARVRTIQNTNRGSIGAGATAAATIDSDQSLSDLLDDIVEQVEDLQEMVDEMIEDGTIDAESEAEAEAEADSSMDDSESDDMSDDETEDTTTDDETMSDDDMSDDGTTVEASTTVEADAMIDVTN